MSLSPMASEDQIPQSTTLTQIGGSEDAENVWHNHHPDRPCPGSPWPLDGKCGKKLTSKDVRELGLTRYCTNKAGKGTAHVGVGSCKHHGGNSPSHNRAAAVESARREMVSLSEQLGEAPSLGNPEIEAWRLTGKMKEWTLILESKMDELNDVLAVTDEAGVEHVRALIELLERAWERYQSALEFMLKYNLGKRVLELEEHQANLVAQAFMTIILSQDLKLSEAQVEVARSMFASQMEAMGAELEPSWASGIVIDAEVVV